jgi:8-oxo-dGTP pyrophosphatase MutT (NUDIX family)
MEPTKPYVQLAVVGMVIDPATQRLLITRRPKYMRSFPGAWVFPGGGVDPNESLSQAIAREVWEETGLVVEDWTLESVWESVYPTIPEPEVPIQAHHLVVYMSGELAASSSPQQLQLCKVEVDDAVWLSRKNVQDILQVMSSEEERLGVSNHQSKVTMCTKTGDDETVDISLKDLVGIYPQTGDRGDFSHGMAQGSLFALEEMWSSRTGKTASQRH